MKKTSYLIVFMAFSILVSGCTRSYSKQKNNQLQSSKVQSQKKPEVKFDSKPRVPSKTFHPTMVMVHNQSDKTQEKLNEDLFKQVGRGYNENQKNYKNAENLIAEGAFISESALFNSILYKYSKDYKSMEVLYLNGGFDNKVFQKLSCDKLKKAIQVDHYSTEHSLKNAVEASEQTALFLSDKVDFNKCPKLLSSVIATYNAFEVSLNTSKLLISLGADPQNPIDAAVKKIIDNQHAKDYENELRYGAVELLVNSGAKLTSKHLNILVSAYIGYDRYYYPKNGQPLKWERFKNHFLKSVKFFLSKGVQADEKTTTLLKEYKNNMPYQHRYSDVSAVFLAYKFNPEEKSKELALTRQLNKAIDASNKRGTIDERAIKFYLNKGALGDEKTLKKAISLRKKELSIKLIEQKIKFNTKQISFLAVKSNYPELIEYLVNNNTLVGKGNEKLLAAAAKKEFRGAVRVLFHSGANVKQAMNLVLNKKYSVGAQKIVAEEGGEEGILLLKKYDKKQAEQKRLAEKKQRLDEIKNEKSRKERVKLAAKREEAERQAYQRKKRRGDQVCFRAGHLFGSDTIEGYVENVSGERIQIRIHDTNSYPTDHFKKGELIWAEYYQWKTCSF